MLRAFAALPVLYVLACLASLWMFVSGMLGWLGPPGHESAGNYAQFSFAQDTGRRARDA
jgi:hypothetical protein